MKKLLIPVLIIFFLGGIFLVYYLVKQEVKVPKVVEIPTALPVQTTTIFNPTNSIQTTETVSPTPAMTTATPSNTIAPTTTTLATTAPTPTVISLTIEAYDGHFSQNTISLKKNVTYKITVVNKGNEDHSLRSQSLGVDTGRIRTGQSKTITITPKNAGTYSFKCNYPCPPGYHNDMQSGYSFVVS